MKWQLKKLFLYIGIILAFQKSKIYVNKFDLAYASTSNINKIIKSLNENKATGPDGISVKFLKLSADVIDFHLANIINNDIPLNKYSKHAKTVTVRPIFKKDGRTNIKNYRPVSLLNIFSKIYDFCMKISHIT